MKKILVHLVSGQNAPNYIAARQINPDKNIYICSEDSREKQKVYLSNAIKGVSSSETVNAYNFEDIVKRSEKIINEYTDHEIILNFTGGTKIMSLASFITFYNKNFKCIYVDTENHEIKQYQHGKLPVINKQTVILDFDNYLILSGHNIRNSRTLSYDQQVSSSICNFYMQNYNYCSNLIKKAAKNENGKKENLNYKVSDGTSYMEKKPNECILYFEKKGKTLGSFTLSGRDSAKFLTGGWVEDYVFQMSKDSRKFSDVRKNVNIEWREGFYFNPAFGKNELDVVCMIGPNPIIIECKSGSVTSEQIYKLKSIRDEFGGRYAKAIIVSYFKVDKGIAVKANENNIDIVLLKNYSDYIKNISAKMPKSIL